MDYELIEKMNQATSKNVANLKATTDGIVVTNDDLNTKFSEFNKKAFILSYQHWQFHFTDDVEPLMKELNNIESTVNKLEVAAYRLDAFTLRLEEKVNLYIQKNKAS